MNDPFVQPDGLLVLHHLKVQNVNAISSPLTWGFPSPTAFLGFVHALERRLAAAFNVSFGGVGIICHAFEAQTFQPNRRRHRIFTQTRNPIYLQQDLAKFISKATPASIVEEGRAHLEVSLVIGVQGYFEEALQEQAFADTAYDAALGMRIAGGSVLPPSGTTGKQSEWLNWPGIEERNRKTFARLRRRLLPGFALVHRPDLLGERMNSLRETDAQTTALDALLDLTRLNYTPTQPADGTPLEDGKVEWLAEKRPGWLVPLPIGYAGISQLYGPGEVSSARDDATPFRFVESLYSLGQWIGPHRLNQLDQLLWHSSAEPEAGLYRCVNRYADLIEAPSALSTEPESTTLQGA